MKKVLFAVAIGGFAFTSCSVDEDPVIEKEVIEVPETYNFERNGNSTVSYDGQTTRILMAKEILASFNDFDNATEESLSNMFSNENDPFSKAEFNESSKSIKSKVAASSLFSAVERNEIRADFEAFITQQMNEVSPNENVVGERGIAGQLDDGSSGDRYINSDGMELNQAFAKGLIGALAADQMLNNYLSETVLDASDNVEDNNQENLVDGKDYTMMEHKWDEAYGYLYGDPSVPAANPNTKLGDNKDPFLFKYMASVNNDSDFAGIADETFDAFKKGRAAIVAGEYDLRDEQAEIIRENISKIIAVRSIYYLQAGKNAIEDGKRELGFHALSEGYGFIYSLRFTHNPETNAPYFTSEQVEQALEKLMQGHGFWDVTAETLDEISEEIAAEFDFTVAEAAD